MNMNRRDALKLGALGIAGTLLSGNVLSFPASAAPKAAAAAPASKCTVGIWNSNFDVAKKLGMDCVQISFPIRPTGGNGDFRNPEARALALAKSEETGVKIDSFAMGQFNSFPFWEIEDAVEQVSSCIDAMAEMKVKFMLLSHFGRGAIKTDEQYDISIRRYREVGKKAADKGVVIAIEAPMTYKEHMRLIEGIQSPGVQIFYDPGNMSRFYPDTEGICQDILQLKGHIVAAHAKDYAGLLGAKLDYAKIFKAYAEAGYTGSQVIEGSVDRKLGWEESMLRDAAYLRSLDY